MLGNRKVGGQPARRRPLVGRHRAQAGMKADERAAADRNARRRAGHHVVVAGAVVALVVADRADDAQLVADRGQPLHVLGKVDAGNLGGDRARTRRGSRRGASGLGSNVSKCDGPPSIQIRMQLVGRRECCPAASAAWPDSRSRFDQSAAGQRLPVPAAGNRGGLRLRSCDAVPYEIRLYLILT